MGRKSETLAAKLRCNIRVERVNGMLPPKWKVLSKLQSSTRVLCCPKEERPYSVGVERLMR